MEEKSVAHLSRLARRSQALSMTSFRESKGVQAAIGWLEQNAQTVTFTDNGHRDRVSIYYSHHSLAKGRTLLLAIEEARRHTL